MVKMSTCNCVSHERNFHSRTLWGSVVCLLQCLISYLSYHLISLVTVHDSILDPCWCSNMHILPITYKYTGYYNMSLPLFWHSSFTVHGVFNLYKIHWTFLVLDVLYSMLLALILLLVLSVMWVLSFLYMVSGWYRTDVYIPFQVLFIVFSQVFLLHYWQVYCMICAFQQIQPHHLCLSINIFYCD